MSNYVYDDLSPIFKIYTKDENNSFIEIFPREDGTYNLEDVYVVGEQGMFSNKINLGLQWVNFSSFKEENILNTKMGFKLVAASGGQELSFLGTTLNEDKDNIVDKSLGGNLRSPTKLIITLSGSINYNIATFN